jgi:predicted permease
MIPAVRVSRPSSLPGRSALRERVTESRENQRALRALLIVQFALSLLLVTIAGLLMRSVASLSAIDLGFDSANVVMFEVADETPSTTAGAESADAKARRAARYRVLEDRLAGLPGVRAASLSWLGLFSRNDLWTPVVDVRNPESRQEARVDYVSSRYFDVVGMQIVRGRAFTTTDSGDAPRVAVVNEAFVRARFGDRDPLRAPFILDVPREPGLPFTIVGVVRDSRYNSLRELETGPMAWMPLAQAPFSITSIALRVMPGAEADVSRQVGRLLSSTDPYVMVRKSTTLGAQVQSTVARERLLLDLSSAFGLFALLLAAIGLYGTLAYTVARRRREFGIRLALGAQRHSVVGMFVRDGLALTGAAAVVGVPLALVAGSLLRTFLFGVAPQDPATVGAACAVLGVSALLAASLPAVRASRIDPVEVLRSE